MRIFSHYFLSFPSYQWVVKEMWVIHLKSFLIALLQIKVKPCCKMRGISKNLFTAFVNYSAFSHMFTVLTCVSAALGLDEQGHLL